MTNKSLIENMGIGIDIVDANRFKKIPYMKKKEFYKKIFTKSEIDYCLGFKDNYIHFAGKFAIKEAVIKSINERIDPLDIKTSHLGSKPIVTLMGRLKRKYLLLASISHEKQIVVGFVLSKKINKSRKN